MKPLCKKKTTIFKGKLYNKESIDLDFSKYRYLLITFVCFDYADTNTGGSSNILELDLTSKADSMSDYTCSKAIPYNIFDNTMTALEFMSIGVVVDELKTTLKAIFTYKNTFVVNNAKHQYYISKIVGIE